jgi:hypothetical protein
MRIPPQLPKTDEVKTLETAGNAIEESSLGVSLLSIGTKLLMGASLAMLFTLANSLQIIATFPLLSMTMPAIVYMVMLNISSISSFEIIEPDLVIGFLF